MMRFLSLFLACFIVVVSPDNGAPRLSLWPRRFALYWQLLHFQMARPECAAVLAGRDIYSISISSFAPITKLRGIKERSFHSCDVVIQLETLEYSLAIPQPRRVSA